MPVLLLAAALASGCEHSLRGGDEPAAATPTSIGVVQGSGPRSPFEGRQVSLSGVVTRNLANASGGFFMQDETGAEDGDPATSDGIFVVWDGTREPQVRRGDRVRVRGTVVELGDGPRTQTALTEVEIERAGRAVVVATVLDAAVDDEADWERLEGMWLRISAPLTVAGNYGLARHGELDVAFRGRPWSPTARYPVGRRASARAARNALRMLVLDDARGGEYPERLWFLPQPVDADAPLRAGSRLHEVEGVLDHRRDRRLQLTAPIGRIEQAPRPAPPQIDGALRLAQFNLLNWFNGDGQGGGFPTARGARDPDELARQRAKLVAMITALSPDVASLVELENDDGGPHGAQQALVDALNAAPGSPGDYRAVPFDRALAGDDAIRVGIIYRDSRVRAVGAPQAPRQGPFAQDARPPLAQAFVAAAGGAPFTVVSAHLKSKRCSDLPAEFGPDHDQGDGQGCWNAARTQAATALSTWLATDPLGSGSPHAVILGDLNANTFESPLLALRDAGWRDAIDPADRDGYSYIFRGQANRLDHALLSPSLARRLAGAAVWHANADEAELFDYRQQGRPLDRYQPDPWRASDHDPLLVVLKPL